MKDFFKNLKRVWKYARNQRKKIILYYICEIIDMINGIVTPIASAVIITHITNKLYYQVIFMAFVLFFIDSLYSLCNYFERVLANYIFRECMSNLEIDLGKEILKLDNKSIDDNSSGVFISRVTKDTSQLADIFNTLGPNLSQILKNVGIFIAVFIVDITCFIFLIVATIITFILDNNRVKIKNNNDKIVRKKDEQATGFISEMVRGVRDIKMLNSEKSFINKLQEKIIDANNERYKTLKQDRIWQYFANVTRDLTALGIIFIIVYLITQDRITPTVGLVIYYYSGNTSYVTYSISQLLDTITDFNVSCSRVFSLLDNKEFKKEKFGKKHITKVKGDFEFKNVSFSYKDNEEVLKNLNFKIKANETVAFVGKSGAGKTTIFNLLCMMYPNYTGKITIDGIDTKELDKDSIRGNITIISQNPYIFNLSIKENLQLVKEDVTDEEIKEACRLACLDTFIEGLKDKYDTIVGEGGINLSGGQKQRLAIARALIQKTGIILFDEATSALDNETQENIKNAIDNMKRQYTILIIAHRLSTIIDSDRILFLNDGKITAEGTHQELLKNCPDYKQLYESEIEK